MTEAFVLQEPLRPPEPSGALGRHGPPLPCSPRLLSLLHPSLLPLPSTLSCPTLPFGASVSFPLSPKFFASVPPFCLSLPHPRPHHHNPPSAFRSPPPPLSGSLLCFLSLPLSPLLSYSLEKKQSTGPSPQKLSKDRAPPGLLQPPPQTSPCSPWTTRHPEHLRWGGVPPRAQAVGGAASSGAGTACSCPSSLPTSQHAPRKSEPSWWGGFVTLGKSGSEKHWAQPLFLK